MWSLKLNLYLIKNKLYLLNQDINSLPLFLSQILIYFKSAGNPTELVFLFIENII